MMKHVVKTLILASVCPPEVEVPTALLVQFGLHRSLVDIEEPLLTQDKGHLLLSIQGLKGLELDGIVAILSRLRGEQSLYGF
jgi:hypothetical protein